MALDPVAFEIPRRLNDPPRLFWWDLDVALLAIAAALLGMLSGFFVTGIVAGLVIASAYGRTKAGRHPAFALHLAYWTLPSGVTGLRCTPPSWLRETIG